MWEWYICNTCKNTESYFYGGPDKYKMTDLFWQKCPKCGGANFGYAHLEAGETIPIVLEENNI
jgi:predicted nucleic-acid-binding Zn-ribbon protein